MEQHASELAGFAERLQPGEEDSVEADFNRASNAAKLLQLSQAALDALSEGEDSLLTRAGIVVFFHTDVSVKATVDYSPSAGGAGGSASDGSATTHHVIQVSGLNADTAYGYTVHAGTASASGSFSTAVDYAAKQNPGLISLPDIYTADPESIGVAKGDPDFLRFLDMFVSNYISSGAYQDNYTHWFGQPGPALTALW